MINEDFRVVSGRLPDPDDIVEAQAFIKTFNETQSPVKAVEASGKSLAALRSNPLLRAWAERTMPYYVKDPDQAHALIVAGLFKEFAEADTSRDRVAAGKALMQVPELGFQQAAPQVGITISEGLLKLDVGRFPGEPEETRKGA